MECDTMGRCEVPFLGLPDRYLFSRGPQCICLKQRGSPRWSLQVPFYFCNTFLKSVTMNKDTRIWKKLPIVCFDGKFLDYLFLLLRLTLVVLPYHKIITPFLWSCFKSKHFNHQTGWILLGETCFLEELGLK